MLSALSQVSQVRLNTGGSTVHGHAVADGSTHYLVCTKTLSVLTAHTHHQLRTVDGSTPPLLLNPPSHLMTNAAD